MSGEVALRKAVREDIGKVWKDGVAVYAMNYLGRVLSDGFSGNFLKEALRTADEKIYKGDVKVYECVFHGGMVK
jgi:hypothetical protein